MKRIFITLALVIATLSASATERLVSFEKLPEKAKSFIATHLSDLTFSYAKFDSDITDHNYDVYFTDGTQVEFNRRGEWRKVDGSRRFAVPWSILPKGIAEYVEANHNGISIVEVEREHRDYQVKLSNDVEIVFDQRGRVKWYD